MSENIKGLIIAAGSGVRLRPLTNDKPKTLLPIFGRSIFEHILNAFNICSINDYSIVTGYKKESLAGHKATYFHNEEYLNNNILHSMMYAKDFILKCAKENCSLVVTYSDIFFTPDVLKSLVKRNENIVVTIDKDWTNLYKTREDNPLEQAERAEYNDERVVSIGKELVSQEHLKKGEFIGLLKLSPEGIKEWVQLFDELDNNLEQTEPFQRASEWKKSYLTDFIQELVNREKTVSYDEISNQWIEFDTLGDYERVSQFDSYESFHKESIE